MQGKKEKKSDKKLTLSELIDIDFLQEFQDAFAKTANIASITVDSRGPITKPSNFTDFCIKYTRGSELGFKRCNECDIKCGKIAAKTGKPKIYTCHAGLTDFTVPIMVEGKHIASILGGQVITSPPDEDHFRNLARELGIKEDEYIKAVKKIKIVPEEKIETAANLLFFVANTISEISNKNLELIKQNERNSLHRKITEVIRSSLDIDKTLTYICEEVAKLLKVQRATIVQFPTPENYEQYTIRSEYKINSDIKGLTSSEYITKAAGYWGYSLLKEGKTLSFDNIQESDTPDYFKKCYEALGVKSMIGFPIKKEKNQWGSLVLSEYNHYRHWTNEEKNLLETISDQIYIAINQAELYDALKQITANQNAILNNIPFMAWLKDTKGKLLAVNEAFAKMCDTTVTNLIGKTDFDFFPKEYAAMYDEQDKSVMLNRRTIPTVEQIVGPEGARWHETFKSPVFDDKGKVVGTVGMSRDITERKEADIELLHRQEAIIKAAERESLLRKIFETMRSSLDVNIIKNKIVAEVGKALNADICFIMTYEPANDYFFVDEHSEYLSSTKEKSFVGVNSNDIKFKWFMDLFKNNKEVLIGNAEEFLVKYNLHDTPEEDFLKEYNIKSGYGVPLYYANSLLGYIHTQYTKEYKELDENYIDFLRLIATQAGTAIHQAKLYSTIKKNEKYTRTVLNSIKDGIITINDDFIIESSNPAVENIWGYSSSELIGQKLDILFHPEIEGKSYLTDKESFGIKKNGEKFPIEIDISEINFQDKKATLVVIKDVTEQKRMEKMKSEFVSTVSHELRTPLTSIKGSLGLVTSGVFGVLPEKVNEMISIANNNCTRLTNLINDILDLEKIKAGKYEFKYEELEINSILDQSIILNQPYADRFGMSIKIVKLVQQAYIKADKNRLLQVISNLISNAVKFSNPGGEVLITSELKDAKIKISFIDKGIGIPEEAKNKIFTSFSQVDSSDSRSKGGTGLGLSICKLIVEKMGGEIDFESIVDKGSTFFFILPVISEPSLIKIDENELRELSAEEDF